MSKGSGLIGVFVSSCRIQCASVLTVSCYSTNRNYYKNYPFTNEKEYYFSALAREHSHLLCVTPMCLLRNYFKLIIPLYLIAKRTISWVWRSSLRATVSNLKVYSIKL